MPQRIFQVHLKGNLITVGESGTLNVLEGGSKPEFVLERV